VSASIGSAPAPYQAHPTDADALALVAQGALVVVNHSGGKDSQAMLAKLRAMVPAEQLLVIHAHLPEVEWDDTEAHARATSEGLTFRTCQANKTFLGMVAWRGMWPSPAYRQCTSDLKRGPIRKAVNAYLRETEQRGVTVINAMGMRAQESSKRKKRKPWLDVTSGGTERGLVRRWVEWLPIHHYTVDDVWRAIREAGQEPHWAYARGMSRLSCSFCIMSSQADLRVAAGLRPDLYARYVDLEQQIGHTVFTDSKGRPVPLEQHTGIPARRLPVLQGAA
jgi:DNA sulfur modification protein DndC